MAVQTSPLTPASPPKRFYGAKAKGPVDILTYWYYWPGLCLQRPGGVFCALFNACLPSLPPPGPP